MVVHEANTMFGSKITNTLSFQNTSGRIGIGMNDVYRTGLDQLFKTSFQPEDIFACLCRCG